MILRPNLSTTIGSTLGGTHSSLPEPSGNIGAGVPPPRTLPVQTKGHGYDRLAACKDSILLHAGRSGPGGSLAHLGYPVESVVKTRQSDARAASFVRLNSFLLRTHVTSLVSALAEDGWLETWEKESLCRQAREDSSAWTQTFFRSYMRFLETEDVPTFIASLRSQII